ncbi:hypothetical protein P8Q88_10405 [Qipengyuania sp. XHP0207]|nr:hypothetical protein [Qipengyuania sp. XHP0207]MDG5748589.1 hypothetical protein [Qipengyuania sp. XHP0207]
MNSKRIMGVVATIIGVLLVVAWIDGGQEPLHPIEQEIATPGAAR